MPVVRLGNGSRTVNCKRCSCQPKPCCSGWDSPPDTDNAPADADAKQQNPEASPKNAAQIAAYAEAAAVVKAAAKAVTA